MRKLAVLGFCTLGLIGITILFWNIEIKDSQEAKTAAAQTKHTNSANGGKPLLKRPELPKSASQALRAGIRPQSRVSLLELNQFLEKHKKNPSAFAAAFDLTSDPKILSQALEQWPGSFPILARILTTQTDPVERKKTIEAIMAGSPNNSFGFYAMAEFLFKEGNSKEACDLMAEAAKKSPPETVTPEDTLMRREAWESTGATSLDAKLKSVMSDATSNVANTLLALAVSTRTVADPSTSNLDRETPLLHRISYLEHIRQVKHRSVQEEIIALSEQIRSLEVIDPELEFGETGMSVLQYKQKIDSEVNRLTKIAVYSDKILPSMSDADLGNYADRWLSLGEVSAMNNLMKENGR